MAIIGSQPGVPSARRRAQLVVGDNPVAVNDRRGVRLSRAENRFG